MKNFESTLVWYISMHFNTIILDTSFSIFLKESMKKKYVNENLIGRQVGGG